MIGSTLEETAIQPSVDACVHVQDCFTVGLTSSRDAFHRMSGFKTEDDARARLAETKRRIARAYR